MTETSKDSFGIPLHKATLPISGDRPITVEVRDFEARGATVRFERWNEDLLTSFKASFPSASWSKYYKTWGVPGKTGYKRAMKWLAGLEGATPGSFPSCSLLRRNAIVVFDYSERRKLNRARLIQNLTTR